jgi:hypothetical protein
MALHASIAFQGDPVIYIKAYRINVIFSMDPYVGIVVCFYVK